MNEEDIRSKILLPYLKDLGFDLSEISLEKSFTIRLGKTKHAIKGRSDILCKRNGKNLFIVEVKNDSIIIGQDDIEQGISYARLLTDNIAPFTILTNGHTIRIFDSVSREELTGENIAKNSAFWQNDCKLSTDIDLRIRYEALSKFISFSPENLKNFCEDQVQDRMRPIIGDLNSHYSKFVKELYVTREAMQNSFEDFFKSETKIFAIVGPAGVGKTNVMCSLALQKLENEFVFFYNAALMNKSPLEHIAQDLNGVFSSKSESDLVLKKLDDLGRLLNKNILIFIDAIDESLDTNLNIELSELAFSLKSLGKIKLCISCKSNVWTNILKRNGTRTHLFEEISRFHNTISSLDYSPGFLLEDFSIKEMQAIIPLYEKAFDFKGEISESVFKALRNGFFLRIFSEVYSKREIPQKINDKDLIKLYLQQSLERINIEVAFGLRILSKIGRVFISNKYSSWQAYKDEGLEVVDLMEKLELSLDESIPEDLFARNILIKSNTENSYNISFYYSKIRDYIICFHSYKLDKLGDKEFYDILEELYENHIGQSALAFYVENASTNHRSTLIKFKKEKSIKYVNYYSDYLELHFKRFKEKFDPETSDEIGILLPEDLLNNSSYALAPIDSKSTNKIIFDNFKSAFSDPLRDLFFEKGIKVLHGDSNRLFIKNQKKSVEQYIYKQLNDIINKGRISVYNSDILLIEQVSTILYYYYKKLGFNLKTIDYNLPRFNTIYPINLITLRNQIHKFVVTEYYTRKYNDIKIRAERINEALTKNTPIPKLNISGDFPPFEELFKIVEILINRGYCEIKEHYLPSPDISINEIKTICETRKIHDISHIRTIQFSEAQAKLYIESFLKNFDSCYKDFVEFCFPTIKERFPFFMTLPHEYFVYMKDSDVLKWGYLGYRKSLDGNVKINFEKMRPFDDPFPSETPVLHSFSLNQILHNHYLDVVKTIDKINTPNVDQFCVLRAWVYKFLKNDLDELFKENKE